jgi:hypothetical protein
MSQFGKEFVTQKRNSKTKQRRDCDWESRFFDSTLSAIEELCVPSHLNGFELSLAGFFWIIFEIGELDYVLVKIGKADGERVDFRMRLGKKNSDVFCVVPRELFGHGGSGKQAFSIQPSAFRHFVRVPLNA